MRKKLREFPCLLDLGFVDDLLDGNFLDDMNLLNDWYRLWNVNLLVDLLDLVDDLWLLLDHDLLDDDFGWLFFTVSSMTWKWRFVKIVFEGSTRHLVLR